MALLDRRQLLALAAPGAYATRLAGRSDLIREENQRPGTTDWQLTYVRADPASESGWGKWGVRSPLIEGYASRTSVRTGETIDFFVSTRPAGRVVIDLYRLGYYQGKGGRHVLRLGPVAAKAQQTPAAGKDRLRECAWEKTASLVVPKDWASGV